MPDQAPVPGLQNRRILIVEDDYILAEDLKRELDVMGAEVLGPVPSVEDALQALKADPAPDAVLLDLNLGGEMAFPVADKLQERGIVCAFITGYGDWSIPSAYAHIPRFEKPLDPRQIAKTMFG